MTWAEQAATAFTQMCVSVAHTIPCNRLNTSHISTASAKMIKMLIREITNSPRAMEMLSNFPTEIIVATWNDNRKVSFGHDIQILHFLNMVRRGWTNLHWHGKDLTTGTHYDFDIKRLQELSKELPTTSVPIADLISHANRVITDAWSMNFLEFIRHFMRVEQTESHWVYPVILTPDGQIMDGLHRILKAYMNNELSVQAKKFTSWPIEAKCI